MSEILIQTILENKLWVLSFIGFLIIMGLKYWVSRSKHKTLKGFIRFILDKRNET